MLLSVDNDGGYLLVHEEEDCEEDSGDGGEEVDVPGRHRVCPGDQPTSLVAGRLQPFDNDLNLFSKNSLTHLEDGGYDQFRCVQAEMSVNQDEHDDGEDDGIIGHQGAKLIKKQLFPSFYFYNCDHPLHPPQPQPHHPKLRESYVVRRLRYLVYSSIFVFRFVERLFSPFYLCWEICRVLETFEEGAEKESAKEQKNRKEENIRRIFAGF